MKKLTTEEFIERAKEIHGDTYDYSLVDYVNNRTKVKIICKKHGEFSQKASTHLISSGCPKCSTEDRKIKIKEKYTTEWFISNAKLFHGDAYIYDNVKYIDCDTNVEIICRKHGKFFQVPSSHLRGCGCVKCFGKKTLTTELFIEKAIEKHGNTYNYDSVVYKHNKINVEIVCKTHGPFWQKPSLHLQGKGCPKCNPSFKLTKNGFIKKSAEKHEGKYDYSFVKYENVRTNVEIVCKTHGAFWQKPSLHLNGAGCSKCAKNKKHTKESFIQKAIEIHGECYDYSFINYVDFTTAVSIKCRDHGLFNQLPSIHIQNHGCPRCNNFVTENQVRNIFESLFDSKFPSKWIPFLDRRFQLDGYNKEEKLAFEYMGEQHYILIPFFHRKKDSLLRIQLKDQIKKMWCKRNRINLIVVRYDEENIENFIIKSLEQLSYRVE